jgi:hypothetical protein
MNQTLEQLKQYFDNTPEEEIRKEWDDLDRSCKDIDPKIDEFLTILNKRKRNDE